MEQSMPVLIRKGLSARWALTVQGRRKWRAPLGNRRGFHERATRVNIFLSRPVRNDRCWPTEGASGSPLSFLL